MNERTNELECGERNLFLLMRRQNEPWKAQEWHCWDSQNYLDEKVINIWVKNVLYGGRPVSSDTAEGH